MAITSTYYDTSAGVPASLVTETDWAQSHPSVGSSEYGVVTAADFKVPRDSHVAEESCGASCCSHEIRNDDRWTVSVKCGV